MYIYIYKYVIINYIIYTVLQWVPLLSMMCRKANPRPFSLTAAGGTAKLSSSKSTSDASAKLREVPVGRFTLN